MITSAQCPPHPLSSSQSTDLNPGQLCTRFLPVSRDFPVVEPSGIHVFLHPNTEERLAAIKAVTPGHLSFADRVNRELDRISSYYKAVGLWVNFEHRSQLLAEALGLSKDHYQELLSGAKMNAVATFQRLLVLAERSGLAPDKVAKTIGDARQIDPKPTARQRMLMMKTIMNSTPIVVADLFSETGVGSYGFGDGTNSQIFQGKTSMGDLAFSAIASPRLFRQADVSNSGYVFRFCVGKCALGGFEEDHPLYMLDTKVVETLTAWHSATFPGSSLAENPLLSSMAKLLLIPTHDWGHSWLLYDRESHTDAFKNWGNDIYNVDHLIKNKLLINYEVIIASMHKYTWEQLFDSTPGLQTSIFSELREYHQAVLQFASFVERSFGKERANQEENYLMYIPLSTLPCVLDWKHPQLQALFTLYPIVHEQVTRILGPLFDTLSSNHNGVPAKSREGQLISTAEYIRAYPLKEEIAARLREERRNGLFENGGAVSVEPFRAFAKLPECITNQFETTIPDPTILPTLQFALNQLKDDLGATSDSLPLMKVFHERIRVAPSGHLFFRLERNEIDYERLVVCEQDKRVLLVEVPAGESVLLRPRISTSLLHEVTKQVTTASDQDMIAFNVQSAPHAEEILQAAAGLTEIEAIHAMIGKANELSHVQSVPGAQDIYPLRRAVAEHLYGSSQTGYRELLGRKRFGCATCGPIELPLHDGSTQRTLTGVLIYIPRNDPDASRNADPNPDIHGIEAGVFDRTYSAAATSMQPFCLRSDTALIGSQDPWQVSQTLHRFIERLAEINLQLDLGTSAAEIGRGLFSVQ